LDEVRESDLLIHVVDISHPNFEEQIDVVNKTLSEIDAGNKKTFTVFNKIDNYKYTKKDEDDLTPITKENYSLEELKKMWFAKEKDSVFISAKKKLNIVPLKEKIYADVVKIHKIRYPYNDFLY